VRTAPRWGVIDHRQIGKFHVWPGRRKRPGFWKRFGPQAGFFHVFSDRGRISCFEKKRSDRAIRSPCRLTTVSRPRDLVGLSFKQTRKTFPIDVKASPYDFASPFISRGLLSWNLRRERRRSAAGSGHFPITARKCFETQQATSTASPALFDLKSPCPFSSASGRDWQLTVALWSYIMPVSHSAWRAFRRDHGQNEVEYIT
jgi:hypothetical protein